MDKTIYIIRHGQTDYNLRGIVQGGGVDTDLNDTGRQQAAAFHQKYHHLPFEAVLTSTQKRSQQTVASFIDKGLPWEQFGDINEMGWGVHEGISSTPKSRKEYRELIDNWNRGNYHVALPEGESAAELGERMQRFIAHIKQRPEKLLLVCSHGRAMRGLMCLLANRPLKEMGRFAHSNTGLWLIKQQNETFSFLKENNTDHLPA